MTNTIKNCTNQLSSITADLIQLDFDSTHIISEVVEQIKKSVPFDAATFYIFNAETNKLEKLLSYKQDVEILIGLQIESGEGLSGWSADSAQPILIADRTKKKSYNPDTDFASFLSIPILRNNILYSVINFGSFTIHNFKQEHVEKIQAASPTISYIVNHYLTIAKYDALKIEYLNCIEKLDIVSRKSISNSTISKITNETANVIHGINNSLSIILGNLQCLLLGKNEFNQKSLSRLKRIEVAAKKIADSNNQILNLNTFVNQENEALSEITSQKQDKNEQIA